MCLQARWAKEDAGDDEDEDEGEKRAPKPMRKPQKKKTKKRPTKQKQACENQDKKAVDPGSLYKAGDCKQQRLKYIQRRRDVGWTFKEAADAWNESSRKAMLLAGMSKSELKRRRFI